MKEREFYQSLYRATIVRKTRGNSNTPKRLSNNDKREVKLLFQKLRAIYLYLRTHCMKMDEISVIQRITLKFLNSIYQPKSIHNAHRRATKGSKRENA